MYIGNCWTNWNIDVMSWLHMWKHWLRIWVTERYLIKCTCLRTIIEMWPNCYSVCWNNGSSTRPVAEMKREWESKPLKLAFDSIYTSMRIYDKIHEKRFSDIIYLICFIGTFYSFLKFSFILKQNQLSVSSACKWVRCVELEHNLHLWIWVYNYGGYHRWIIFSKLSNKLVLVEWKNERPRKRARQCIYFHV